MSFLKKCCSSTLCVRVTCKVHTSVRRHDNYMREPCHLFYRGCTYLQETILWGFHPYQETVGRIGPNSVASSFRTLWWSSSGPKALDEFKPLSSLVTPSFETTMSSMKGADLLIKGTSLWSLLLNTSVNWPLNSSACSFFFEAVKPVPPILWSCETSSPYSPYGVEYLDCLFSDYWCIDRSLEDLT